MALPPVRHWNEIPRRSASAPPSPPPCANFCPCLVLVSTYKRSRPALCAVAGGPSRLPGCTSKNSGRSWRTQQRSHRRAPRVPMGHRG
eukprot:CAMPEP_0194333084 /NCGR_PEP_ID=MMETSP0171-20130528/61502_1 /TAXON_ID=218684 /ORGANISM="Corethron pennatum, Strain L29A3" /LENGTH=87 /DNA_ID=CAMNT_0039095195 /DNA_START=315 /DNA_END=574 /DNA_ORIENTATION=-